MAGGKRKLKRQQIRVPSADRPQVSHLKELPITAKHCQAPRSQSRRRIDRHDRGAGHVDGGVKADRIPRHFGYLQWGFGFPFLLRSTYV